MLFVLTAIAISNQGFVYSEYVFSKDQPLTITLSSSNDYFMLLPEDCPGFDLEIKNGYYRTSNHSFNAGQLRSMRISFALRMTVRTASPKATSVGVWEMLRNECSLAIGLAGEKVGFSFRIDPSEREKPQSVCLFPVSGGRANIEYGTEDGDAYLIADGSERERELCRNRICRISTTDEHRWFVMINNFSIVHPLLLNFSLRGAEDQHCKKEVMSFLGAPFVYPWPKNVSVLQCNDSDFNIANETIPSNLWVIYPVIGSVSAIAIVVAVDRKSVV